MVRHCVLDDDDNKHEEYGYSEKLHDKGTFNSVPFHFAQQLE